MINIYVNSFDLIIMPLLWTVACLYFLYRLDKRGSSTIEKTIVVLSLALKAIGSYYMLLSYVGQGYGDMFGYFEIADVVYTALIDFDSQSLFEVLTGDFEGNMQYHYLESLSTRLVGWVGGLCLLLSFGSYVGANFIAGIIASIGILKFYFDISSRLNFKSKIIIISFLFLMPSLSLWGVGVMKEPFIIYALFSVLGQFWKYISSKRLSRNFGFNFWSKILIIFAIKPYYLIGLAFAYLGTIIRLKSNYSFGLIGAAGIFVLVGLTRSSNININYRGTDIFEFAENYQSAQKRIGARSNGSTYDIGDFKKSNGLNNVKVLFQAANVTFFRPGLFEIKNVSYVMLYIENLLPKLFIALLLIESLILYRKVVIAHEVWFILTFVIVLGIMTGVISSNYGSLARYRTPFNVLLPILIYLTLLRKLGYTTA